MKHIGQAEIGRELGVTRQAVSNKRRRRKDFPSPDVEIDGEPGWLPQRLGEIVSWWRGAGTTETVTPPPLTGETRAAPPATFREPGRPAHSPTCKCFTCKPPKEGKP